MTDPTPAPPRPKLAFVAGGGAIKAYAFHLGVLRGLEEDGFAFAQGTRWDAAPPAPGAREIGAFIGSSAGACVCAAIASGHPVSELEGALTGRARDVPRFGYRTLFVPVAPNPAKYARRLLRRWRIGSVHPLHTLEPGGIFTSAGVERYFRRHVLPTNRFADLAAELYLIATQVSGARQVVFGPLDSFARSVGYDPDCAYYDNVEISHALAASVAVPPAFAPYAVTNAISGKRFHYYDGEVREALSTHVAADTGADFVIASSIWSAFAFDERVGSLADLGMSAVAEQAIHQAIGQKVDRQRRQLEAYDRLLARLAERDSALGVPPAAREAFRAEVCDILRHRPMRALFVSPAPDDRDFFFESFFRFDRRLVRTAFDTGYRAYRRSAAAQPAFFDALDRALA